MDSDTVVADDATAATRRVIRLLAIADNDYFRNMFSENDTGGIEYELTFIVGARELLPRHILGIRPDGGDLLLALSEFDVAVMLINHVQGTVPYEYICSFLSYHRLPCALLYVRDGHASFGGALDGP